MNVRQPLVVIAGMGKGLGSGLAKFFIEKNYRVIGLNRSPTSLNNNQCIEYQADLTDEQKVTEVAALIAEKHGVPDVLIHNTQRLVIAEFESTNANQFEASWRSITLSAFLLAQSFLPAMTKKGGTMIVAGATASIRGGAKLSAFSSAKFALRGLVQSLARSYQKSGVHVVHVLLDGIIDTESSRQLHQMDPEKMMQPEDIAQLYWQIINQPKSTWVHELDLRPSTESF